MSPMQAVAVILLGAAGLMLLANLIKAVVHKEFTFSIFGAVVLVGCGVMIALVLSGCGALFAPDEVDIHVHAPTSAKVTLDGAPSRDGIVRVDAHQMRDIPEPQ